MSGTREIKRRIGSVSNIAQVTNAMQLVAASRMKKAQENAERGKVYADKIRTIVANLSQSSNTNINPFIDTKYSTSKNILVIVFSPQRGLAGSLPGNLLRLILKESEAFTDKELSVEFITIGKKIGDQIGRMGKNIIADFSDMPEFPTTADIHPIVTLLEERYLEKEVSAVYVLYPEFINSMTQVPMLQKLLPLELNDIEDSLIDESDKSVNYVFEPSESEILKDLIPNYIETQLFQKKLETVASEYSARMISMKSATDNANDILSMLNIEYNKKRQAVITKELAEINAGRTVS